MDLVGLARVCSAGGKWYVLVIVDDYSRYAWVFFLADKGAVLGRLGSWAAGPEELLAGKAKEFEVHCWTSEIMGHTKKMGCAACIGSWAERGGECG
jgi:hypothetical protein